MKALKPCGTYAAYARHKRHDEPVDDACEAALRAYMKRQNQRYVAQAPMGHCPGCDQRQTIFVRGWCRGCYRRWQDAGKPADGPPPLLPPDELRAIRARAAEQARAVRNLNEAIRRGGWEWAA